MRRLGRAALALSFALLLAGCGGDSRLEQRTLDAFFTRTARGRAWARIFPRRPGALECTVLVRGKKIPATCSTDVSLVKHDRAVVTLTKAWNRGAHARTLFVFIRRNGEIESIVREATGPKA